MPRKLYLDIETRSDIDLRASGQYVYAEGPRTQIILIAWAIDDAPIQVHVMLFGDPLPADLEAGLLDPEIELIAHNAGFERILLSITGRRYLPPPVIAALRPIKRWNCTAARAARYGLPRTLAGTAKALGLATQKDTEGHSLMLRMCRPWGVDEAGKYVWRESPAEIKRLGDYCVIDVAVERAIDCSLPNLSATERLIWQATERMNDRGIAIDEPLLMQMALLVEEAELDVNDRLCATTKGAVPKVTNHKRLRDWLVAQGFPDIEKKGVGKAVLAEMLDGDVLPDLPVAVIDALVLRREGSKASSAKYRALINRSNRDGRVRGALIYCGAASTGRFSSRGAQLQNLPRGGVIKGIDRAIDRVMEGATLVDIRKEFGPPLFVASELVRPTFVASAAYWLARGDYAQIELRINAWLAGEYKVIQAFRDYDTILGVDEKGKPLRKGPDLYKVTAANMYDISIDEVDDRRRQSGKVTDLACIAEGQPVLTDHGLVPIEKVTLDMRVWDGYVFVRHHGTVYQGEKECIEYDGLTATEDHLVFVEGFASPIRFRDAASRGLCLKRTGMEGKESWHSGSAKRHDYSLADEKSRERISTYRLGAMYQMSKRALLAALGADLWRPEYGVPIMRRGGNTNVPLVAETPTGSQGPVYQFVEQAMEALRRARDYLRLSFCASGNGVVPTELGFTFSTYPRVGIRQDQKQQGVRSRQSSANQPCREPDQSGYHLHGEYRGNRDTICSCNPCVQGTQSRNQIRGQHTAESAAIAGGGWCAPALDEATGFRKTRRRVWDILEAGPRNRFTVSGRLVHNCGFQGGLNALKNMARIYGIKKTDEEFKADVDRWREKRPNIKRFWYALDEAAIECMSAPPGLTFPVRSGIYFKRTNRALAMRLPSGSSLLYWEPKLQVVQTPWGERERVTFLAEDSVTKIWRRWALYGGLLCENCLAGDTYVLTNSGWKKLSAIQIGDLLWDGIEWVGHDGLVNKGYQNVIEFAGIQITPDHRVLTRGGMVAAAVAHPSEVWRAYSEHCRIPPGDAYGRNVSRIEQRTQGCMALPLRLRRLQRPNFAGIFARLEPFLWMRYFRNESGQYARTKDNARDVKTSRIPCLAIYARKMFKSTASSLSQLWWPRHPSLCILGSFRNFLERHGACLPTRVRDRKSRQQSRLLQEELHLGNPANAGKKPPSQRVYRNPLGSDDRRRSCGSVQDWKNDIIFSCEPGLAKGPSIRSAKAAKKSDIAEVFDILNAGPRHRFTVQGTDGRPFVVSNCVQSTARDVMADAIVRLFQAGLNPVLTVHDEGVCEVPRALYPTAAEAAEAVRQVMVTGPAWTRGLPIAVDASAGFRYVKA